MLHTPDGGDIEIINGLVTLDDGLFAAVYLSLFGGNDNDSGLPGDQSKQWWGNFGEVDPARCYRSETQFVLTSLPATTGNLRRLEAAIKNDLAWLVSGGMARAVTASASMPARNRVNVAAVLSFDVGEDRRFDIPQSWGDRAA